MSHDFFDKGKTNKKLAQHLMFEMFYERVYATVLFIINDRHLAQDITQETFIKAFKQLHTLREPKKTGAWLATIATRTSIDYLRKLNGGNEFAMEDVHIDIELSKKHSDDDSVEKIVELDSVMKELYVELDSLKPEYREVLILKYLYDMKDKEIAEKTNAKIGTVKSRLHRAKANLATRLDRLDIKKGDLG